MENQQLTGGKPWAAYNIIERGDGPKKKRIWSRIGNAFHNRDGSINIYLDSFPVNGKVQIREDDREKQGERGVLAEKAEA